MLQGLPLGGLDLFGNRLFFFRLFVGLSCCLTLHPTGAGGKLLRGDILFRHIAAKVGIKPGQPPMFRDMEGVLPFAYNLCLGIHLPPDVQIFTGGPQFIILHFPLSQRLGIGDGTPRLERLTRYFLAGEI